MSAFVYLLQCADTSLYTGWTSDPTRRLLAHQAGTASKYTRARLPIRLVYLEHCPDRGSAMRREAAIKKLSRVQKLALIKIASASTPSFTPSTMLK
jgi:putative endonuclease